MSQSLASVSSQPLVGYSSPAVPRELLYAAGCRPCFLGNSPSAVLEPGALLEREFFGARAFNTFNEITADEARRFRAVVLSRTSEQEFKLFLYLSELARGARISQNTRVYLFNLLQTEGDSTKAYGVAQVNLLAQSAKEWSGKDFGEADLRAAIEDANRARQTLAEGLKLRSQCQCATGCAVMDLVNAYYSLEPREFCEFAKTWSAAWKAKPKFSAPRILLLGDIPAGGALHSFIEGENAVVSVEDSWLGERAAVQPLNAGQDAIAAIADYYMHGIVTPRRHSRRTSEAWLNSVRNQFDGAVFFYSQSDAVEGWDRPWQTRLLTEQQKPFVQLCELTEASKHTFKAYLERLS